MILHCCQLFDMDVIMALEVEWWMVGGGLLCYAAARMRRDGNALVHWLSD